MRTGMMLAATLTMTVSSLAQKAPAALTKDEATRALVAQTRIGQCAQADPPVWESVQTVPAIEYKPRSGSQETHWLLPVKAHYSIHCTQGNRNMKHGEVEEWQIEVMGDYRMYRDPYGELQVANNFDSDWSWDDQYWSNAKADVRCRSKRLAWLTYDVAGKVTNRRVDPSTAYGDCNVRLSVPK